MHNYIILHKNNFDPLWDQTCSNRKRQAQVMTLKEIQIKPDPEKWKYTIT